MEKKGPNRPVVYIGTIIMSVLAVVQAGEGILPRAAGIAIYVLAAVLLASACVCLYRDLRSGVVEYILSVLILNVALSGVILLTIAQDTAKRYPEVVVISIATYTFYKITMAVVNMVKVRKMRSPVLITIRNIGVADALVSMLTLQATMLASFQGSGSLDVNRMNAVTGMVVCVLILALGVSMILYALRGKGAFGTVEKR